MDCDYHILGIIFKVLGMVLYSWYVLTLFSVSLQVLIMFVDFNLLFWLHLWKEDINNDQQAERYGGGTRNVSNLHRLDGYSVNLYLFLCSFQENSSTPEL